MKVSFKTRHGLGWGSCGKGTYNLIIDDAPTEALKKLGEAPYRITIETISWQEFEQEKDATQRAVIVEDEHHEP